MTTTAISYAHTSPPPDATDVDDWEPTRDGGVTRSFWGTIRQVGDMRLSMWGNQDGTGRVTERVLVIDAGGIGAIADPCEPGDVRELAAELLAVAEELERLSDPGNTIQQ